MSKRKTRKGSALQINAEPEESFAYLNLIDDKNQLTRS